MNVTELTPIIIALHNAKRTGMFWGSPGIGKSASFRAAAEAIKAQLGLPGPVLERHQVRPFMAAMDRQHGAGAGKTMIRQCFGLFDLRLSQMDPVEVGGLPRENRENGTMEKLPPSWFAHTLRDDLPDHGVLLLEELPSAPLSVQTTAYQITLDHVIEEYKLKPGWSTFAAGNRLTDGGQYFKMPNALANRMCHVDVESDMDSWCQWAVSKNLDPSLIAFIRFRPDLLNTTEEFVKERGKGFAFATERQWEAVNDFLANNQSVDETTTHAVVSGLVGGGPAAEYIGFRRVWNNMPSIDGILVDPAGALLPEDAATQFAVVTALAARASYDNLSQCLTYADRLMGMGRPEMTVMFVKDMQARDGVNRAAAQAAGQQYQSPINAPAFTIWATKNAGLFG